LIFAALTLADVPTIAVAVLTLVLLEGLLSADNALVLAVMVRHLPKHQQKRALRYGIWGAFIFRLIAVIFAFQLIQFWQLKVLGGLYLLYLAIKHFLTPEEQPEELPEGPEPSPPIPDDATPPQGRPRRSRFGSGFWATVINVELADIAFSIDSILAAVGMVAGLPARLQQNQAVALGIIYLGGVLGIVMMRLVAGVFLVVLNRYKGLAGGAYVLVGWIGLKLIGGGLHDAFHPRDAQGHPLPNLLDAGWRANVPDWIKDFPWEMNDLVFWAGMALIVVASLLYRPGRRRDRDESGSPGARGDGSDDPAGVAAGEARGGPEPRNGD
jgi:YkoY family integral membrane protein